MRRRETSVRRLASLAVLLAACLAIVAAPLAGRETGALPGPDLKQLEDVSFISVCTFSHRNLDDPIVFPGRPNTSHDHSFFGASSTDAFSTRQSLLDDATTCNRAEDTAAYWVPTLLRDDRPVAPIDMTVHYNRRTLARVKPFPPGLQMIAGNSRAMEAQSGRIVFWSCGELGRAPRSIAIPSCEEGVSTSLRLNVRFPDCWDGKHLDSPDHMSHMAYSSRGLCPPSHRTAVPSITFVVQYPLNGGTDLQLASIGQFSGHGDFVNAWQQDGLKRLVDYCLNAVRTCGHAPA